MRERCSPACYATRKVRRPYYTAYHVILLTFSYLFSICSDDRADLGFRHQECGLADSVGTNAPRLSEDEC